MDRILSKEDLLRVQAEHNIQLPFSDNTDILLEPFKKGALDLPNRIVSMPMEGVDADPESGAITDFSLRRYKRLAEGGSGLIWAEACAVVPEGKSNPKQFYISNDNVGSYKRLVDETKAAAVAKNGKAPTMILQLTHSGRFSRPYGVNAPVIAQRIPDLEKIQPLDDNAKIISDDELDTLMEKFVQAALLAEKAGFDGVDMKSVHAYLVAELFKARLRKGKYGGSYENRTRFYKDCVKYIKQALSKKTFVCTRLTVYEPSPFPYGWGVKEEEGSIEFDMTEPLKLISELKTMGIDLLGVSIGYPRTSPHWNRPYNMNVAGAPASPEHPILGVKRFIDVIEKIQKSNPDTIVVSAGTSWLGKCCVNVAAEMLKSKMCTLAGFGRGLLAYPNIPNDLKQFGEIDGKKCCITCSKCSQIMKDLKSRSGCVMFDSKVYLPEYRQGREFAKSKGLA